MTFIPLEAIGAVGATQGAVAVPTPVATRPQTSFANVFAQGVERVNDKLQEADKTVRNFALDDSVPLHQVTFALEQARLNFELLLQVRNKLTESFQELERLQL